MVKPFSAAHVEGPAADWRPLALKRTCGMIALFTAPAALVIAASPGPFGLFDHASVAIIFGVTVFVALFGRDPRHTGILSALMITTVLGVCLGLAARIGMGPGPALGAGSALVLVAVFFGTRVLWGVAALITLAILALGAANQSGWLHAADPAKAYDWTKMIVWMRVAAGFVAAMSIAACAVATVIARLEDGLRERNRLLEAERLARERLARVHRVTASLLRAGTPEEVIEAACRVSSEALVGQSAAAFWMLKGDGSLHLAASWGSPTTFLDQFRVIPADASLPCQQVARSGKPLWIETEDDYRTASPDMYARALKADRLMSYCLFPLVLKGIVQGVVAFVMPIGHKFDDDERAYYETIRLYCSQALERASLYETARESAERADLANRLKDEFLSTVSHELRTPLNAIMGWVRMLRLGTMPGERREHALEVIERNAAAQAKLIADLLDVSRINAGRLRLNLTRTDAAAVAQTAVDSVRPAADAKEVRLAVRVDGTAPVLGDVDRLHQVVCNLLTNAVKFSASGGQVDIVLEHVPPQVVFSVRDCGAGIRPEFLPHVFGPFRQAEAGFARPHGGLGLGLAIAKSLVTLHGGTIEAKSDGEGRGATFIVRLPAALDPSIAGPPSIEGTAAADSSGEPDSIVGRELAGLRVLLVEDEPDTRELLLTVFEACGATARGSPSAADALEQFQRERPDLLISDIGLPGEDGLTLICKLRTLPGGDMPAVALTAFVRPEDRNAALAAGYDAHVAKPVDPRTFVRILTQVLRDRPARRK